MHEESLIVIKPGSQRMVYDGRFVATLINDLNAQTGTYGNAEAPSKKHRITQTSAQYSMTL